MKCIRDDVMWIRGLLLFVICSLPPVSRTTGYIDQMSAWYDKKTAAEVVNLRLWGQLKVRQLFQNPFSLSLPPLTLYCPSSLNTHTHTHTHRKQ